MSKQKRVLVVDDSRAARLVLRRMLEKHDLGVDTVESATEALDFLSTQRPDAIFMDHMMPGMDGFQAVKAIKANPQTATIPVMMYTSKGGDLYLGQARALGAVGVLPKTVAPAQLFESLRKIGLVGERRRSERALEEDGASERAEDMHEHSVPEPAVADIDEPDAFALTEELPRGQLEQLRNLLEEQRVEFRKDVLLSMETVARQTTTKMQKEFEEQADNLFARDRHPGGSPLVPTLVLAVLLAISLLTNLVMYRGEQSEDQAPSPPPPPVAANDSGTTQPQAPSPENSDLETEQAQTRIQLKSSWATIAWALDQSLHLQYPYDQIALDKQRIDIVEALLGKLRDSGFRGKVLLETHAGRFCLLGDQDKGFHLPPPDLSVDKCEFIGNPVQAADTPGAQQSLRFANFLATTPLLGDDSISLEVQTLPRDQELSPYPEKSGETTAMDWNQAAQANNRVLVELVPAETVSQAPE